MVGPNIGGEVGDAMEVHAVAKPDTGSHEQGGGATRKMLEAVATVKVEGRG